MTIEQKIDEAYLWLEHIKFYSPDISVVKYFFSAYLSSVSSISDYILAEANQFYSLGLSTDSTWYPRDFEIAAKKIGKSNALKFYKWWKVWTDGRRQRGIGKVFNNIRNMEIHKIKQKPILNILILPLDNQKYEIPHKLPVSLTQEGVIASTKELDRSIKLLKPKYLKEINKIRKEKGISLATNIKVAEYLQVEGLPGIGSLVDACGIYLQMWIDFAKMARELFEESKTGEPKTGLP
ncbi:MAG: hypothetical protein OES23_07315 [Nitrosopumilus sp.]|nr:hypothetical protein [Nitrosopumilus sp.]